MNCYLQSYTPMALVWNHWHLFKAIYLTESKRLKSALHSVTIVVLNQGSQGSISEPLFFNIFICDLLFDIDIDLANYADDTTSYAYDLENERVIKLPEKNINKLFHWSSDNSLKGNPDKCHLHVNDENVVLKIKNETY